MANKLIVTGSAGAGASLMAMALSIATPQITTLEGQRNQAYRDIVGVLTVCSGHTGKDIVAKKVYTDAECKAITKADAQKAADGVLKTSPQLLWHPIQLASAISFSYNVGTGTYANSTVARLFNEGDFVGACNFLPRYNKAGGKVVQGLINRRALEQSLCLSTLTPDGVLRLAFNS